MMLSLWNVHNNLIEPNRIYLTKSKVEFLGICYNIPLNILVSCLSPDLWPAWTRTINLYVVDLATMKSGHIAGWICLNLWNEISLYYGHFCLNAHTETFVRSPTKVRYWVSFGSSKSCLYFIVITTVLCGISLYIGLSYNETHNIYDLTFDILLSSVTMISTHYSRA